MSENVVVKNSDAIDISLSHLPQFLSSKDLVLLGIFSHTNTAYVARLRGYGPKFLKIGRKVLYPKEIVIQFLKDSLQGRTNLLEEK